jgi:hypothetical protein
MGCGADSMTTRNQEFSIGTAPSDYTFGGILGTREITRFSLSNGFQNHVLRYKYELQLAHYGNLCFGMGSSGWAVVSAGKGWRRKVILKVLLMTGTLFISVEKKLNESQSLNFTGFYTPNTRGKILQIRLR